MNERLAIGNNKPPSESEILQQRLAGYTKEEALINGLISQPVPNEIMDDIEAGKLADLIKSLKSARITIEKIFKDEKEPFLAATKVADSWKNAKWAKIDDCVAKATKPILAWNKKKEYAEKARQLELARQAQEAAEKFAKEAEAHAEAGIFDTAEDLLNFAIEEENKSEVLIDNADNARGRSVGSFASVSSRKVWVGVVEDIGALDIVALKTYFTAAEIDKAIRGAISDGVHEIRGVKIFQEDKITIR